MAVISSNFRLHFFFKSILFFRKVRAIFPLNCNVTLSALHDTIKGEPGLPGLPLVGGATGRAELIHTPTDVEHKDINENFPTGFIVGPPGPKGDPVRLMTNVFRWYNHICCSHTTPWNHRNVSRTSVSGWWFNHVKFMDNKKTRNISMLIRIVMRTFQKM